MQNSKLTILAIETSCDETACAIVEGHSPTLPVKVLASVVASSEEMHRKTGGIIPEVASREQLKTIIPVIKESIKVSKIKSVKEIDAIAVTVGPGLVGSLLVGVETAKALSFAWNKPLIPVNHLVAHLYANYVSEMENVPELPAIGLVVSGGHTDLVSIKVSGHKSIKITWLGGTRDDAAGECLDKCARLLGLPYPGGLAIAAEAAAEFLKRSDHVDKQQGPTLPRPLIYEETWDFSFSGLKTAVARAAQELSRQTLAHDLQEAVVDVLVAKLERAVREFKPKSLLLGGGVSANQRLRQEIDLRFKNYDLRIYIPPKELCTDNAVMIGAASYYYHSPTPWKKVQVEPGLEIG